MAVTETTTESWGSRLGTSIKGVIFGFALFIVGFPVLFWNEGNSVKTAKAIDEGEGACIAVESNDKVDAENEGKLVHMSGKADTKDILSDGVFGISAMAINLKRTVEMYQWIEESHTSEKKKMGGSVEKTTTYTYKKDWVSHAINSSSFKESGHDNPGSIEFPEEEMYASNVSFGAYKLSEKQIRMIGSSQTFVITNGFQCALPRVQIAGNTIYVPNAETRGNALNNRDVASQTRIGDMRVTFRVIYPHDVSIIAKQRGDSFIDYTAKNGKKLNYLENGIEDAASMFSTARTNNAIITWLVRIGGFLLMFFGISMILKPLSVLADVLPILGDIVEMGNGLVAGLVALFFSLVTIAVAWIFYRPVVAAILLAGAGFLVWKLIAKCRKAKAANAANAPNA